MAAARLLELAYSRRNIDESAEMREGEACRATYPLIVAVHTTVIAGTFLRGGRLRPVWLIVLLLAQPLRAWVLLTLRRRWNARGAVSSKLSIATDGPYAYVRHPNYAVVVIELLSLPLTFGLTKLALLAGLFNGALLFLRIRDEERLLFDLPEYESHFAAKKRFIPGVF